MQYKTTIAQKPERGKRVKEFKCPYIALDIVIYVWLWLVKHAYYNLRKPLKAARGKKLNNTSNWLIQYISKKGGEKETSTR